MDRWRNGSAFDSRSKGYPFKSGVEPKDLPGERVLARFSFSTDRVFINQYGYSERNHQLGDSGNGEGELFADLSAVAAAESSSSSLEGHVAENHTVIQPILEIPWWDRIWVLQEIARSRWVFVQYRQYRVEWRYFAEIFRYIAFTNEMTAAAEQFVLCTTRLDPRDKIYGLLGLLVSNDLDEEADLDYSKSTRNVYIEFARSHMNLTTLCSAEYGNKSALGLPSWCPNWSVDAASPTPFLASGIETGSIGRPLGIHSPRDTQDREFLGEVGLCLPNFKACKRCSPVLKGTLDDFSKGWICAVQGDFDERSWLQILQNSENPPGGEWKAGGTLEDGDAKKMTCLNRRFFLSAKGFMGFGPAATKVGDVLYTFSSNSKSATVFVIRRPRTTYR
ncbi:uncharacterized protein PAC_00873 [Phialocephala subalpina]|uniref:Heterokaryon incompatibility domain-containing protein n=1 Tax=Phialocephala subalpina TaxID=576137 RepID=A0A1L7WE41_9HELO|nr:uncharacterized protein PAC_00873 [Phialocephala subalpina]